MEKFNENEGVWRTIGGRRVFIRTGQSLSSAMRESGKFKTKSGKVRKEDSSKEVKKDNVDKEEYELFKKAMENPDSIDPMTENSTDWEALEKKYKDRYEKETKRNISKNNYGGNKALYDLEMSKYSSKDKLERAKEKVKSASISDDERKYYQDYIEKREGKPIKDIISESKNNVIPNKTASDVDKFKQSMDDDYKEKLKQRQKEIDEWESKQQRNVNASYDSYDKDVRKSEDFIKETLTKNKKSTNETMNEAIRAKASKKTKAFKDDLPKKVEIKTQGTSNRKEVSENIQAHILEYYDSPDDFIKQMDVFDNLPTKWHAGKEIAKGGSYLIYNQDMSDFLDSLKINPKGKKFSDEKAFDMYTSLIGRESEKLYNRLQKNAYNKYMKEHPLSKMTFEEFKKSNK